jgi:hypothetical protein
VLKLFHRTANGNMDGADLLADAAILNFINICIQQTPHYFVGISRHSVEFPQLCINNSYPNSSYWPYQSWLMLLVSYTIVPERDQLQNCLDSTLAELENWLKANQHTKLNQMSHKQ